MTQDQSGAGTHQYYANYKRTLRIVDLVFGSFNLISTIPFILKGAWVYSLMIFSFFLFNLVLSVVSGFRLEFLTQSYQKAKTVEVCRHAFGMILATLIFIFTGWWEGLLILALGGTIQMGILFQRPEIGRLLVVIYSAIFSGVCLIQHYYDLSVAMIMMALFLMIGLTFVEVTTYLGRSLIRIRENNNIITQKHSELLSLYNELDGVISVVAHDLRSPFARIKGLAQILPFIQEAEEEKEIISKMIQTAEHGLDIVSDILALQSTEIKNVSFSPIELTELVQREVFPNFDMQVAMKNVTLEIQHSGQCEVTTSKKLIVRILDNLVSNAVKYSAAGKKITVGIYKRSDVVLIYVKDEGPGFSEDDKKHVFKKFKRLSARPTGNESSTGLGLFIVKQLVSELSGSIRFMSELGKGTIFEITLPIKRETDMA
jgi:signal transduction histidine kinase